MATYENLPALAVVLPLLGAPLCMLAHRFRAAWLVALLTTVAVISIVWELLSYGPDWSRSYFFGGWPAPHGIEYRLDALNLPFMLLVAVIMLASVCHAPASRDGEIASDRLYLLYLGILLHGAGLLGVLCTNDIFNLFVFVEISSLSAYSLLGLGRDRRALTASFRYLILGSIGATFLLIGIAYLYAATGTLNLTDIAEQMTAIGNNRLMTVAYAFITIGFALKFALFPLHDWLPAAYRYAPSTVSALFAATGVKIYLYAWLRVSFGLFDTATLFEDYSIDVILLTVSAAAILVGSVNAARHNHVKGILAWSSVAQVGFIVVGISTGTVAGIGAAILYAYYHGLIKGTLFFATGCLTRNTGGDDHLKQMTGLGRRMPWPAAAMVISGLALIGTPLTAGFIGKWQLATAVLQRGWWPILIILLLGSLCTAFYVLRILFTLYAPLTDNAEDQRMTPAVPGIMLLPIGVLCLLIISFGFDSHLPMAWSDQAAHLLLGQR